MSVNKTISPINNLEIKKLKNAHFLSISNKHAVPEPDAICCIANPNNNFPIGLSHTITFTATSEHIRLFTF